MFTLNGRLQVWVELTHKVMHAWTVALSPVHSSGTQAGRDGAPILLQVVLLGGFVKIQLLVAGLDRCCWVREALGRILLIISGL